MRPDSDATGAVDRTAEATVLLKDAEAAKLAPTLVTTAGRTEPDRLALEMARTTLGRRSDNDLAVDDAAVSRYHAEVVWDGGRFWVVDLGSRNGVLVDGVRVAERARLEAGSQIRLGTTTVRFEQPEVGVAPARPALLIAACGLLDRLDPRQRARLARELRFSYVPDGGVVMRQGERVDRVLFVDAGALRLVEVNDEGGEREVRRIEAGAAYGELALLPGQAAPLTVAACGPTCVAELPREAIDRVIATDPASSQTVYLTVREKLRTGAIEGEPAVPAPRAAAVAAEPVTVVGEDRRVVAAAARVAELAAAGRPALVVGEHGVGKRTLARHYHRSRGAAGAAFTEVSLADLEPGEREAALFGSDGDGGARPGLLEVLDGGTLAVVHAELLDAHLQAKLATYLDKGFFHRRDGRDVRTSSTRVVLLAEGGEAEITSGLSGELAARLEGATVPLPPLAGRVKDIPVLAAHFLGRYARREGKKLPGFSQEAREKLVSYGWPGNVSELENVVERAAIVAPSGGEVAGELVFVVPPEKDVHKLNLLRNERVRSTLRHPLLFKVLTWTNVAFVALVLAATLFGAARPAGHPLREFGNNFGMVVTWLVWFPVLPLSALLLGRVWCGVCPIAGAGDLAARVRHLGRPLPRWLKRGDLWLLVASFVFLDFVEEFFGVADAPAATAVLLVVIIGLSALFCVLYERKAFCRTICPLAGMLGAYASLSPWEVRGNKKVCQTQCGQHTCFKGTGTVPGCPLGSYPASITSSIDCMMCGNCLKSCDNRGVQVNLRPPLSELWRQPSPALAMSVFGVILVALMARHQFPMLTVWQRAQASLGWSDGTAHVVLWIGFVGLALVPFFLAATLSSGASQEDVRANAARYGLAFIPLALAGHLGHIAHEWLLEGGGELAAYAAKVFQAVFRGAPIGSVAVVAPVIAAPAVVTFVKFLLVAAGASASLAALLMIARRAGRRALGPRLLPYALLLLFFAAGYVLIFTGGTAGITATVAAVR